MIRFTTEAPPCLLPELRPLTDLDFALAHKVLTDSVYTEFYANRPVGRELILDNSVHELGEPLLSADLLRASKLVHADFVIAPDRIDDPEWTLEQYTLLRRTAYTTDAEVVGVLCGDTPEIRSRLLDVMWWSDMLCLPYRKPRLEWWEELPRLRSRIHLLGVSTLDELRSWTQIARDYPDTEFSIDTAKPIKAALLGRRFDDGSSLRSLFPQREFLELQSMTFEQERLARENIISLLHILRGED
jgi:hypothetical protein